MKILLALGAVLICSGCVYQTVSDRDIERASEACGGLSNVTLIRAFHSGVEEALCRDGKTFTLKE